MAVRKEVINSNRPYILCTKSHHIVGTSRNELYYHRSSKLKLKGLNLSMLGNLNGWKYHKLFTVLIWHIHWWNLNLYLHIGHRIIKMLGLSRSIIDRLEHRIGKLYLLIHILHCKLNILMVCFKYKFYSLELNNMYLYWKINCLF